MDNVPEIIEETDDFAVVFKPPKMHCTSSGRIKRKDEKREQQTLLEWYKNRTPSVFDIMHRLDYETNGLVLFAKNETSFIFFKELQDRGEFIKEYTALVSRSINDPEANNPSVSALQSSSGFPPCPVQLSEKKAEYAIESFFRPFGPGRKLVRPVIADGKKYREVAKDKGGYYRTEIFSINGNVFSLRLKRGFRHQIRCHLAWAGFPVLNDPLYSEPEVIPPEFTPVCELALRSHAIIFSDLAGRKREYRIPEILKPQDS